MKSHVKWFLLLVCVTFLASDRLFAQEWSDEQKEVWKNVGTYWDLIAKRDLEGFMSYFHDEYSGWDNPEPLPSNKATVRKFVAHDFATTKVLIQQLKPVAIKLHGNIAIVHYYFSSVIKDVEGKEGARKGRWTDILMKQGNKWVLIADHGGLSQGN